MRDTRRQRLAEENLNDQEQVDTPLPGRRVQVPRPKGYEEVISNPSLTEAGLLADDALPEAVVRIYNETGTVEDRSALVQYLQALPEGTQLNEVYRLLHCTLPIQKLLRDMRGP
jgi:hypothetical protein